MLGLLGKGQAAILAGYALPAFQKANGVIPQGIDLDGFSATGRDHPISHLRVHPRQLIAGLSLGQQAVGWIDMDPEPGAADVMVEDVAQDGEQMGERVFVAGDVEIAFDGVEIPKRRVGGVIQPLLFAFREKIRDESVADMPAEHSQH